MTLFVRRAITADVPWIVDRLREFALQYGTKLSLCPTDPAIAADVVQQMIDEHVFFVAVRNGELAGCVAGYFVMHPFNPSIRLLAQAFWLSSPGILSGRVAAALLDAFIAFGHEFADWITFGAVEGVTRANARHFVRRGFRLQERSYLLEVNS